MVTRAEQPDYVGVIRQLLDGEIPEGGYWWTPDETNVPRYKGQAITDAEMAALSAAVPDPDDRTFGPERR